jgi:hypothetical protein
MPRALPNGQKSPPSDWVCLFWDSYHDLFVGPCSERQAGAEAAACRHVEVLSASPESGFDCDYAGWVRLFRKESRRDGALPPEGLPDPAAVLSAKRLAAAERARRTGAAFRLSRRCWAERRDGGWVVRDRRDWTGDPSLLVDVAFAIWSSDADDALKFPTPQEAWVAYVRSQSLSVSRRGRRATALRRLGRQ